MAMQSMGKKNCSNDVAPSFLLYEWITLSGILGLKFALLVVDCEQGPHMLHRIFPLVEYIRHM